MQRRSKVLFLFAFVCCLARAQIYTGNDIHSRMISDSVVENMVALGFVGGVLDSFAGVIICPPDKATIGQARDVVKAYLASRPESRHMPAATLTFSALTAVWPCPKRGSKL